MFYLDTHHFELLKKFMKNKPIDISHPVYKAHYLLVDSDWYEMPESTAIILSNLNLIHQLPIPNEHTYFKYKPTPELETHCIQARDVVRKELAQAKKSVHIDTIDSIRYDCIKDTETLSLSISLLKD